MRRRLLCVSLAIAACSGACNGLIGNEGVSLWHPDAAAPSLDAAGPVDDAASSAGPPTGIARQIVSDYAGTCVDVGNTGAGSGSSLTLTLCADLPEQLIVFRDAGAGAYALFNPKSGLCIGADQRDAGIGNGTGLALQACSDAPGQSFHVKGSAGAYQFVAPGNFCIDDHAFGAANGARVHLWGCNTGLNQQWAVVP